VSIHPVPAAAPVVELSGGISDDLAGYGRDKIAAVLAHAGHPVPHSRLRVVRHHDPARAEPVVATVVVDLDGRPVHVRVTAGTPREAVDLVVARLARRLERTRDPHRRHPDRPRLPVISDELVDRPVRRTVTPHAGPTPVDTAAADLLDRDLAFVLFVEAERGVDSIVHRAGPTGIRLIQSDGRADLVPPGSITVDASTDPAPWLSVSQAVEHLRITGTPFVFHVGAGDRAAVVHRTRDGGVGRVAFPEDPHERHD
jgi:hypothetical protein